MEQPCWYCGYNSEEETCPLCRRPTIQDVSGKHLAQKLSEQPKPVRVDSDPYRIGYAVVKVYRKDWDEITKKEKTRLIHEGIVVDRNSRMLRVFNMAPTDKGGDISPEMSQFFPIASARCWCELVGMRKIGFPIPATLQ